MIRMRNVGLKWSIGFIVHLFFHQATLFIDHLPVFSCQGSETRAVERSQHSDQQLDFFGSQPRQQIFSYRRPPNQTVTTWLLVLRFTWHLDRRGIFCHSPASRTTASAASVVLDLQVEVNSRIQLWVDLPQSIPKLGCFVPWTSLVGGFQESGIQNHPKSTWEGTVTTNIH